MDDANAIVSNVYRDFDAFTEAIEDADIRFTMPRLDRPRWEVTGVDLPSDMHLQIVGEGSGNIAQGSITPDHGCILYLLQRGKVLANGEEISPGSAFLLPEKSEFVITSLGATRWSSVYIPASLLDFIQLVNNRDERKGERDTQVIGDQTDRCNGLWPLLDRFLFHTRDSPDWSPGGRSLSNFQRELLVELVRAYGPPLPVTKPSRGRPTHADRATIMRAADYIESRLEPGVSIAQLVKLTDLPERSLRAGFQRYLGVSPNRFLQLRLLHVARQRLVEGVCGETTVTQVAGDLGVWDFGRFAMRYRKAFGELPSATLARE